MTIASVRKFLVALLTACGGIVPTVLTTSGPISTRDWIIIALAIVNAAGVYLIPNAKRVVTKSVPTNATATQSVNPSQ